MTTDTNQENTTPVLRIPFKNEYYATLDEPDNVPNETAVTSANDPANPATIDQNPENPQEATYKKRYDDLKRHYDKTVVSLRSEVTDVKKQLSATTRKEMQLPATPEALQQWKQEYPDVYAVVKTIAALEANDRFKLADERVQEVEKQSVELQTERTLFEIRKAHPDFDELSNSSELHEWLAEQPVQIQDWLYANYSNAGLAIRVLTMYKVEKNLVTPTPNKARTREEIAKDAAKNPSGLRSQEQPTGQKRVWKTSEIKKLRPAEFDKYEKEIDQAAREGRIVEG